MTLHAPWPTSKGEARHYIVRKKTQIRNRIKSEDIVERTRWLREAIQPHRRGGGVVQTVYPFEKSVPRQSTAIFKSKSTQVLG